MTADYNNKEMLREFVSEKANNQLEAYIKDEDKAWAEDSDGETRVYLVKDGAGEIALFFSIKCGLLVVENPKYKLTPEEREYVGFIVDAKKKQDDEALNSYYGCGESEFGERIEVLFELADRRIDAKKEAKATGQTENWRVKECVSAMELRHLCKNESYMEPENLGVPLGFGIFWEVIVPRILKITKQIGCKYIYLFAADNSEEFGDSDIKKLVFYYKNAFKFYESANDDLTLVKPDYDEDCFRLIQEVKMLEKNRETIWQEFSDV
ncbi:MAG: hypothetical protein MR316_09120 [Lachnospiraceae bacterium]|nr:hypothetical protein [Lachnospiraceae bacterium]